MKLVLSIHRYAPELNQVILPNGARLPAPHVFTIRDARFDLFKRLPIAKFARIVVTHTQDEHKSCDKIYSGRINSLQKLLEIKRGIEQKHNLPDAQIKIESVRIVG